MDATDEGGEAPCAAHLFEDPEDSYRVDVVPAGREDDHAVLGYSPAVRVGDVVYVSGILGSRDRTFDEDPGRQFDVAFARLAEVLAAAGCTMADLVEVTSFHVGLQEHLAAFGGAKARAIPAPPYPAMTSIGVSELAYPGALVEIRAVAHRPPA